MKLETVSAGILDLDTNLNIEIEYVTGYMQRVYGKWDSIPTYQYVAKTKEEIEQLIKENKFNKSFEDHLLE